MLSAARGREDRPTGQRLGPHLVRLLQVVLPARPELAVGAHAPAMRGKVDQCDADEVTLIRGQVITCRVYRPQSLRRTRQCHKQPKGIGLEHEAGSNVCHSSGLV